MMIREIILIRIRIACCRLKLTGCQRYFFYVVLEVELTPKITGIENEDDFQFTWYTYQLYASGFIPQRDTLAKN